MIQQFLEWTSGMQNRTSRFLRKANQWRLLINGHSDVIGSTTKRLGFKHVGTADLQADKSVLAVDTGGYHLWASSNDSAGTALQIKYNDSLTAPVGGAWQNITEAGTVVPTDCYVQFLPYPELQKVYITGAKATATDEDHFLSTQTATYEATPTIAQPNFAPPSKFIIRYGSRIVHGYCARNKRATAGANGWTTGNWYNETVEYKAERIIWTGPSSTGSTRKIYEYEDQGLSGYTNYTDLDGAVTGLAANASLCLAWTNDSMWMGDLVTTWKKRYSIGCDAGRSVKNVDIFTFWLNKQGIWAFSGGKPELISTPIQPVIDGIADVTACFAGKSDENHYRLYVGTLTLEGYTFRNCVIQYTISTNSWSVYSYSIPADTTTDTITSFGSFDTGTAKRMYMGTSEGVVYVFSEGADATPIYTDGDQTNETYPITFMARTGELDYGLPHERKSANTLTVYSRNGEGMSVSVLSDPATSTDNWSRVGQVYKDIEVFPINPRSAYWHQVEFTETSTNPPLELEGFSINVKQDTEKNK